MKKIGIIGLFIIGIALIFLGRMHWNNQIAGAVAGETLSNTPTETANAAETVSHMVYTKNLSEEVVHKLEAAKNNNEMVNLTLIAGSEPSWVTGFKKELISVYGENVWNIETVLYEEQTSLGLLQGDFLQQVQGTNPDVILYEAPLFNDNGQVVSADSIEANRQLFTQWLEGNPDMVIMVQPSHPIYGGVFYPQEVANFQVFMETTNHIYLNHWAAWPNGDSEEILTYLASNTTVNELGYQLWVDYLLEHFISR